MRIKLLIAVILLIFAFAFSLHAQPAHEPTLLAVLLIPSETGTAYDLAWTPDGEWLAVVGGFALTMFETEGFQPVGSPINLDEVLSIDWYPEWFSDDNSGQLAYVGGYRHPTISLIDFTAGDAAFVPHRDIETAADQYAVAWRPDGKVLAALAGDENMAIQLYDIQTDTISDSFPLQVVRADEGEHGQFDFVWLPDGETIMGAAADLGDPTVPLFFILNTVTGDLETATAPAHMQSFDVSPDGKLLAVVDEDGTARLHDAGNMEMLVEFMSVEVPVAVRFSPDGAELAILSYHTTLQVWDVAAITATGDDA